MTPECSQAAIERPSASVAAVHRLSGASRLSGLWTLYALTLRQHVHGKRWLVMGLLFLVPAALAVFIRATTPDVPKIALEFMLAMMFLPQALLPLVALLYSSGIIQDEQEEQTITYLLVRPIAKWAIYTVKLLATLTTAVLLTVLFTGLTYACIYVGAGDAVNPTLRCLQAASIHSLAVVAYCCLFGLLSLVTKRILIVGVLYTAVVEGLLANLPFGIRHLAVIYYTRLIAYRTMDFIITWPNGRTHNMAAEAWQLDLRRDPQLLEHPDLSACLAVVSIASVVCAALGAWLCWGREFHVKTPEKE